MLFVLRQDRQTRCRWLQLLLRWFEDSWRKASCSSPERKAQLALAGKREWQTCCHAVAGGGAKLGPLFTVCLFLSYLDLTGRVG